MYRYKIVPRKKSKAQLRSHVASVPIICTFGEWQIDNNTRGYLRYFNKWIFVWSFIYLLFTIYDQIY